MMTELKLAGRERWLDFRGVPKSWDVFYAAAKAKGFVGAIRYIASGSDGKQIHSAEREAAARQRMKLLLVDELNTGDAWDSANDRKAGVVRGAAALFDAKQEGFGLVGISAAADAHAPSPRHISDAVMYATGFASVVLKEWAGFYGFMEVLRAVHTADVVSWYWLAGSKPSAEDARWLAFWQDNTGTVHILGVECDVNWRLDGPIPGAPKEEDMQPTDLVKDPGPNRWGHTWLNTNQVLNNGKYGLAALGAKTDANTKLLAELAKSPDATPEQMKAWMDEAVAKAMPVDAIIEAVRRIVPEDIAEEVVQEIGEIMSGTKSA
jgi:hypothetical protein